MNFNISFVFQQIKIVYFFYQNCMNFYRVLLIFYGRPPRAFRIFWQGFYASSGTKGDAEIFLFGWHLKIQLAETLSAGDANVDCRIIKFLLLFFFLSSAHRIVLLIKLITCGNSLNREVAADVYLNSFGSSR